MTHTFPINFPSKTTFGDVDVLISLSESPDTHLTKSVFFAWMKENLTFDDHFVNNTIFSFAFEGQYQVDFILVDDLAMAKFYFSYGDVGSVLGHFLHHQGLTYGQKGLTANLDDGKMKIHLTHSPSEICAYLGLSMEKWLAGFTTDREIHEWITDCRLYHPSQFDHLKTLDDPRRSLRPFYQSFFEYIQTQPRTDEEWITRKVSEEAVRYFGKEEELAKLLEEKRKVEELRGKYHGGLFRERGVPHFLIRDTMKVFEETMDVHNATAEEIIVAIEKMIEENREKWATMEKPKRK